MINFLGFFRRRKLIKEDQITITEDGVSRVRPDGVEEKIRWDDLHEVSVLTTDEVPWQEDVYFLLIGADGKAGCAVPQSSKGCDQLLKRLQELPGFDNEAVIRAMGSTSDAKFVCWKRKNA